MTEEPQPLGTWRQRIGSSVKPFRERISVSSDFQHFHVSRLLRFFFSFIFPEKKIEAKEKGVMGGRVRGF